MTIPAPCGLARSPRPPRIGFWEYEDPRIRSLLETASAQFAPVVLTSQAATQPGEGTGRVEVLPVADVVSQWRDAHAAESAAPQPQSLSDVMAAAVDLGLVDGAVGGVRTPSAQVLRSGLRFVGTTGTVSMAMLARAVGNGSGPGRQLLLADCAVVPVPTREQLVDIARSAIATWESVLGTPPCVAFLSTTTKSPRPDKETERIRGAMAEIQRSRPDLVIDGELQADAALLPEIAMIKGVRAATARAADILVFPNLASSNISYKLLQHLAGYEITAITQGLRRPFFDLSRGADRAEVSRSTRACADLAGQALGASPRGGSSPAGR